MNNDRFEQLKASLIETGMIMRGELKPSREFVIERTETRAAY